VEWFPEVKPDRRRGQRNEEHTKNVLYLKSVLMIMVIVVVVMVIVVVGIGRRRKVNTCFGDFAEIGRRNGFFREGHNPLQAIQLKYPLTTAINSSAASSCAASVLAGGGSKWKRTCPSIRLTMRLPSSTRQRPSSYRQDTKWKAFASPRSRCRSWSPECLRTTRWRFCVSSTICL
jgi:hypothetical protein